MLQRRGVAKWALAMTVGLVLSASGVSADPQETPLPPWGLVAEETASGVELSWNAPAGSVDAYRVYRAESWGAVMEYGIAAFEAIGQTTDSTFVDSAPSTETADSRGVYYVTALAGDAESLPSSPADGQYPHCWNITEPFDCFIP